MANNLITPFRFVIVEEGIYRGSYPTTKNFRFLKRLKLKTIISLTPSDPSKDLVAFCQQQNIQNIHFSVPKVKDDEAEVHFSQKTVAAVLRLLIDMRNFPIFIHCLDGAHNTGLVVMCLRKLQHWSLSVIFSEFSRYTRDTEIFSAESEFVENFNHEVSIPFKLPHWLWEGQMISRHPSMRIALADELKDDPVVKKKLKEQSVASVVSGSHHHQNSQQSLSSNQQQSTTQSSNNSSQIPRVLVPSNSATDKLYRISNTPTDANQISRNLQALNLEEKRGKSEKQ